MIHSRPYYPQSQGKIERSHSTWKCKLSKNEELLQSLSTEKNLSQCCLFSSVSVSAQDGIVALGKANTRSPPSLGRLPKVALETVPIFASLNTDRPRPWRVECRPLTFSTPLSFRRSMLWCSGLSVLRSSSSLGAPLPCQTADQMWYLLCLSVYLPVHSHWLRRTRHPLTPTRLHPPWPSQRWACGACLLCSL